MNGRGLKIQHECYKREKIKNHPKDGLSLVKSKLIKIKKTGIDNCFGRNSPKFRSTLVRIMSVIIGGS